MAKREEFLFEIEVPPKTLPMSRLAEYVSDLAELLGQQEHVHLIEIRESSTLLVPYVDDIAFQKVQKQVMAIRNGSASARAMKSYQTIDERLAEDGTTAVLRAPYGIIIQFPGTLRPVSEDVGPVRERETIDGEIIQIGGRDETISVYVRDHNDIAICTTTRDKGKSLAKLIFQQVRVHGESTWIRANERWKRTGFVIDYWDELKQESLQHTIQRLQNVHAPDIDKIDPFAITSELKHGENIA